MQVHKQFIFPIPISLDIPPIKWSEHLTLSVPIMFEGQVTTAHADLLHMLICDLHVATYSLKSQKILSS